ncbi:MAG: hypothetical protein JNK67_05085 [Alphaproteobacteria bacterium]|nr:hypothetical protein [Alphaproteobacteria bacterium]
MSSSTSSSRRHVVALAVSLAAGLLVFAAGSEALVRVAMQVDPYETYRARFRAAAGEAIAIGDSRTAANIAGPGVENLGQPGDDLQSVLEKLAARHARRPLRLVLLQADPHQFAAYRVFKESAGKLADLVEAPPPLAMLRPHYRQYLLGYWRAALAEPSRFLRPAPAHAEAPPPPPDPNGKAWRDLADSRVQFHVPLAAPQGLPVHAAYRRTIEALRRDGVAVCLVTHPVSRAYREAAARYPSFAAALALYDRTAAETGAARANFWDQVEDRDFADTDHLGAATAPAYTTRVLRSCFPGRSG